jgi:TPR repeat protein
MWFRKAANQGYEQAQFNLGVLYQTGQGVPPDYAAVAGWWRKAADRGFTKAAFNLGVMYQTGKRVPQDYTEAVKYIAWPLMRAVPRLKPTSGTCLNTARACRRTTPRQ